MNVKGLKEFILQEMKKFNLTEGDTRNMRLLKKTLAEPEADTIHQKVSAGEDEELPPPPVSSRAETPVRNQAVAIINAFNGPLTSMIIKHQDTEAGKLLNHLNQQVTEELERLVRAGVLPPDYAGDAGD